MKRVNELFGKIVDNTSSLYDLELGEVKFSKKNNTAIVYIKVTKRINPIDIIKFIDKAKEEYSIDEFKVRLISEYISEELENTDIENILMDIKNRSVLESRNFKNSEDDINKHNEFLAKYVKNSLWNMEVENK